MDHGTRHGAVNDAIISSTLWAIGLFYESFLFVGLMIGIAI